MEICKINSFEPFHIGPFIMMLETDQKQTLRQDAFSSAEVLANCYGPLWRRLLQATLLQFMVELYLIL